MDSSSAAHDSVKDAVPGNQAEAVQSQALVTAQVLPYAFAKRHGVLIGQIDDDMVKDPYCGVYFAKRDGVLLRHQGKDIYFCSEECRDNFLSSTGQ